MSLKNSAKFCHYSALEFLCITTASNFRSFKCYCTDPVISHDPTLITWQKDHGAQSLTGLKTFVFMSMMPSRNVDSDANQEWGYFFFFFFDPLIWLKHNFSTLSTGTEIFINCVTTMRGYLVIHITLPALLKTSLFLH